MSCPMGSPGVSSYGRLLMVSQRVMRFLCQILQLFIHESFTYFSSASYSKHSSGDFSGDSFKDSSTDASIDSSRNSFINCSVYCFTGSYMNSSIALCLFYGLSEIPSTKPLQRFHPGIFKFIFFVFDLFIISFKISSRDSTLNSNGMLGSI